MRAMCEEMDMVHLECVAQDKSREVVVENQSDICVHQKRRVYM